MKYKQERRSLRLQELKECQKVTSLLAELPIRQKKTDLLQSLNQWHRERVNNALINKSKNVGQLSNRQTFELQPVSGGLQIIRQV